MAQRPFETVSARPSSGHPDALNLQEVREAGQIDVLPFGVELRARGLGFAKRRDRIAEPRGAAVELAGRVRDIQAIGQPHQFSFQRRKPVIVTAGVEAQHVAGEFACESPPVLVQVEHALEAALA